MQRLFCNHCGDVCHQFYFKCLQCPTYTICQRCVQDPEIRRTHNPASHTFYGELQANTARSYLCDRCEKDVTDLRYMCLECISYDLCNECFVESRNTHGHTFAKIASPWDIFFHGPGPLADYPPSDDVSLLDANINCDICRGDFHAGWYFLRVRRNFPNDRICTDCEASATRPELRTYPLVKIRMKLSQYTTMSRLTRRHDVICDVCNQAIDGVQYKCISCPDYDMCSRCLVKFRSRHNVEHQFVEVDRRCTTCLQAITGISYRCHTCKEGTGQTYDFCSSCVLQPNNQHAVSHDMKCRFGPTTNWRPQINEPNAQATIHLGIRCDLCGKAPILGSRMKCLDCPDFDTCTSCFTKTPAFHPRHRFIKIAQTTDIVYNALPTRTIHPAHCDACQGQIIGRRFKCVHPDCPDFDLCQDCEALPFSIHPRSHALLMSRTSNNFDYTDVAKLAKTFLYILPASLSSATMGQGQKDSTVSDASRGGGSSATDVDCVICQDAHPVMANVECGHLCLCESCAREPLDSCPICRVPISRLIKIYR